MPCPYYFRLLCTKQLMAMSRGFLAIQPRICWAESASIRSGILIPSGPLPSRSQCILQPEALFYLVMQNLCPLHSTNCAIPAGIACGSRLPGQDAISCKQRYGRFGALCCMRLESLSLSGFDGGGGRVDQPRLLCAESVSLVTAGRRPHSERIAAGALYACARAP